MSSFKRAQFLGYGLFLMSALISTGVVALLLVAVDWLLGAFGQ